MGVREEVTVTLRNKFQVLADVDEDDQDVNIRWQHCKRTFVDTCKEVLGYRETTGKEWMTEDTWKGIEARREGIGKHAEKRREYYKGSTGPKGEK